MPPRRSAPQTLAPPLHLAYRIADYDADDTAVFVLEPSGANLDVSWESTADDGSTRFEKAVLERAKGWRSLGAGGKKSKALLPLLLSREALAAARAGKPVKWSHDDARWTLEKTGTATIALRTGKTWTPFSTLVLEVGDVSVHVLDDERWPLVLRFEWSDDCGWFAFESGAALALSKLKGRFAAARVAPVSTSSVPPAGAPAGIFAKKNASTKALAAALQDEKAVTLGDLDAVLALAEREGNPLSFELGQALRRSSGEEGFAAWAGAKLSALAAGIGPHESDDYPEERPLGSRQVDALVDALSPANLEHPPLRKVLWELADQHPNRALRASVRPYLLMNLEDAGYAKQLAASLAQLDVRTATPQELIDVVRTAATLESPRLERKRLQRLVDQAPADKRGDVLEAIAKGLSENVGPWVSLLLEWQADPKHEGLKARISDAVISARWNETGVPALAEAYEGFDNSNVKHNVERALLGHTSEVKHLPLWFELASKGHGSFLEVALGELDPAVARRAVKQALQAKASLSLLESLNVALGGNAQQWRAELELLGERVDAFKPRGAGEVERLQQLRDEVRSTLAAA